MPELPEVETICRGIAPFVVKQRVTQLIVRQPRLRWPVDVSLPEKVAGESVAALTRRGKYLLMHFPRGALLWHMGMSGRLCIVSQEDPVAAHDHVDCIFESGHILRFTDPRRFGALLWTDEDPYQHPLLKKLGPEPLSTELTAHYLYEKSQRSKQSIKNFIMDSQVVVGVGNIYANESLFVAGIAPEREARQVPLLRLERWIASVRQVLTQAIDQGGTTLKDFVGGDGQPGYFQQKLKVYGRAGKPCLACGHPLIETRLAQRTTVFCKICQA